MTQQPFLKPVGAGPEGTEPPGTTEADRRTSSKARADRPLPTDRLRFANQEQVLIEVANLSGNNRRGITAEEMSTAIGLKGGTGGLNSRFFRSANWFEAVGRGEYTASRGLLDYVQHINVDPTAKYEAAAGMRDEVRGSWFWTALEPLLVGGRPIKQTVALLALAKAAGASDHTDQLDTILEWLTWVGLIVRDGDTITLRAAAGSAATEEKDTPAEADDEDTAPSEDDQQLSIDSRHDTLVSSGPQGGGSGDTKALVEFNMSVRITAEDARSLSDEQMKFLIEFAEKLRR